MDFTTFVLLNAVIYIRPQEFVPGLVGLPFYNAALCLCLVCSLPTLLVGGTIRSIFGHPIGTCVLTVAFTAILSALGVGGMDGMVEAANDFLKIILYYLLLVAIVRTPSRMKWLMASIVINTFILASISIMHSKDIIHVPNLKMTEETGYIDGESFIYQRIGITTIFGDPNDFCVLLAGSIINLIYVASDRSTAIPIRILWLFPLAVLFLAMRLTYSRGGMLALLVGLAFYLIVRYGRRGLLGLCLAAPIVLGVGGRQFDFKGASKSGSGQSRIEMWDLYLGLFFQHPVRGVGFNHSTDYADHVAHNSYIHAYAELGFFGGTAFLASMGLSVWVVWKAGSLRAHGLAPELARLWPFLLAGLASYIIGICSLSRCYVIPTYTILGLAAAFEKIAVADTSRRPLQLDLKLIGLLLLISFAYLFVMYIFIKRNVNYG